MLYSCALRLFRHFFGTTCTFLALLCFTIIVKRLESIKDDELAIMLVISAVMGAHISLFFGACALVLRACALVLRGVQACSADNQPRAASALVKNNQAAHDPANLAKQQVKRIKDALSTVVWDTHPDAEFCKKAYNLFDLLDLWDEHAAVVFNDEEQAVIYNSVCDVLAPQILDAFVNSELYDASLQDHADVAALLAQINNRTLQADAIKQPPKQPEVEIKQVRFLLEYIDMVVHKIQSDFASKVRRRLAHDAAFVHDLTETRRKMSCTPFLTNCVDGAAQRALWDAVKLLLKPGVTEVFAKFAECEFQLSDVHSTSALQMLESLDFFKTTQPAASTKVDEEATVKNDIAGETSDAQQTKCQSTSSTTNGSGEIQNKHQLANLETAAATRSMITRIMRYARRNAKDAGIQIAFTHDNDDNDDDTSLNPGSTLPITVQVAHPSLVNQNSGVEHQGDKEDEDTESEEEDNDQKKDQGCDANSGDVIGCAFTELWRQMHDESLGDLERGKAALKLAYMEAVVFSLEHTLDPSQIAKFLASDATLGPDLHAAMLSGYFNRLESQPWTANARNILVGALSAHFGEAKDKHV